MDSKNFQELFVSAISRNLASEELLDKLIPVGTLSTQEVFNVYRGDYAARLTQATGDSFEGVWAVLGDEDFFAFCAEFISKYKSDVRELGDYTQKFTNFIKDHPILEDYPFLYDLAYFEDMFWELFHQEKIENNFILGDDFFDKKLIFSKNLKIFCWKYKILDLWEQRKIGLANFDEDINSNSQVILFKNKSIVEVLRITPAQFDVLKQLVEGDKLIDILDQSEISQEEMSELFMLLTANKLIIDAV